MTTTTPQKKTTKKAAAATRPATATAQCLTRLTAEERKALAEIDERLHKLVQTGERHNRQADQARLAEARKHFFETHDNGAFLAARKAGAAEKRGSAEEDRAEGVALLEQAAQRIRSEGSLILRGIAERAYKNAVTLRDEKMSAAKAEAAELGAAHVEPVGVRFWFDTRINTLERFLSRPELPAGFLRKFVETRLAAAWE